GPWPRGVDALAEPVQAHARPARFRTTHRSRNGPTGSADGAVCLARLAAAYAPSMRMRSSWPPSRFWVRPAGLTGVGFVSTNTLCAWTLIRNAPLPKYCDASTTPEDSQSAVGSETTAEGATAPLRAPALPERPSRASA